MNKIKKILAVVLTMAMVMAMGITSFAATTINLTDADNAKKSMIQVIAMDPKTPTGWKFVNGADSYIDAFGTDDEQAIIVALIKNVNPDANVPSAYSNVQAASSAQLDKALSGLTINGTYTSTVDDPGLYAIKATEEGYTYKNMAVYVEFGSRTTSEVEAKKSATSIDKISTGDAADGAVAIGDTVSYQVTSSFPYIDSLAENKSYIITDSIDGAEYIEGTVVVKLGNDDITTELADKITISNGDNAKGTLTVDLTGKITNDNANANKTVIVTYDAKVVKTSVNNTVSHNGNSVTGSNNANVYTGQITLTKKDATNDSITLAGAGFNVVEVGTDGVAGTTPLRFVEETTGTDGMYVYDPEGTITEVKTGTNGDVVIKGLDEGTYKFVEITAPDGYSINEQGKEITLTATKTEGKATTNFTASDSLTDTKLSALPSTGGIGTTIFTVVGCLIMIAAAAMFFVSRRKAER